MKTTDDQVEILAKRMWEERELPIAWDEEQCGVDWGALRKVARSHLAALGFPLGNTERLRLIGLAGAIEDEQGLVAQEWQEDVDFLRELAAR